VGVTSELWVALTRDVTTDFRASEFTGKSRLGVYGKTKIRSLKVNTKVQLLLHKSLPKITLQQSKLSQLSLD
jgi:hypothetical protein